MIKLTLSDTEAYFLSMILERCADREDLFETVEDDSESESFDEDFHAAIGDIGNLLHILRGNYSSCDGEYYYNLEHMTRNSEGYILYKGNVVEHYSFDNKGDEYSHLILLKYACELLEKNGIELNMRSVVWRFDEKINEIPECDQESYRQLKRDLGL